MPSIWPWGGLGVALGGFGWSFAPISTFCFLLSTFSWFKVRGSRFNVRRSASGRNLKHRKAALRPSAVSLAYIARPGGGCSRASRADYARFVEIATGSVFEGVSQATIGRNQGFLNQGDYQQVYDPAEKQSRLLSGLRKPHGVG